MPNTSKSVLKPFIRVTILSTILALVLIYLGINYHWGVKPSSKPSNELVIPEKVKADIAVDKSDISKSNYSPEIIISKNENALLDSMNKEQITEHCANLLSREYKDQITLELATVNCVMSNYQETFQNLKSSDDKIYNDHQKQLLLKKQCIKDHNQKKEYSLIDRELLIGMCVSDRMNSTN